MPISATSSAVNGTDAPSASAVNGMTGRIAPSPSPNNSEGPKAGTAIRRNEKEAGCIGQMQCSRCRHIVLKRLRVARATSRGKSVDGIRLQMIRAFQPTFSAALIGYLEAAVSDEREKQRLAQVTPMTDTAKDYVRAMVAGISNQGAWNAHPKVRSWLRQCRLDAFGKTLVEVDADDVDKRAILRRVGASAGPAIGNLRKLSELS